MIHIPIEIQVEIIKRILDVKLLIRMRSVSKVWKSLTDSKDIIPAHTNRLISRPESQHHRLLVRYGDLDDSKIKYISFVDDDSFRHHQKITDFPPNLVTTYSLTSQLADSSHGLFCIYDNKTAVIWNPSIKKSVPVTFRKVSPYMTRVGFGVCPRTLDPKLVMINDISYGMDLEYTSCHQVEVFTLSSGSWRSPLSTNLPHKWIEFRSSQAVIDGFIYWDASVTVNVDGELISCNLLMSFDLTREDFRELCLPDYLAHHPDIDLYVFKLRHSLAVIEFNALTDIQYCAVWMMTGHGDSRSFNKLFTIASADTPVPMVPGFSKSGAPIIERSVDFKKQRSKLSVYEPRLQHENDIGLYGRDELFSLNSYVETLLLLDQ